MAILRIVSSLLAVGSAGLVGFAVVSPSVVGSSVVGPSVVGGAEKPRASMPVGPRLTRPRVERPGVAPLPPRRSAPPQPSLQPMSVVGTHRGEPITQALTQASVDTSRKATTAQALARAGVGALDDAPSAGFAWPVTPHEVVRRFDPPEVVWGAGHRGVDLRSSPGAPVVAPSDGVVTFSGSVAGRGVLTIRHPQGFDTTYEPVSHQVSKGASVHRGEHVADLEPGHCEPACLHWGYKVGPKSYRDPLTLIAHRRPVLLPPL